MLKSENCAGLQILRHLLPDTKLTENIPQQIVCWYITRDGTEVVHGLADIHGDEVGGDLVLEVVFRFF